MKALALLLLFAGSAAAQTPTPTPAPEPKAAERPPLKLNLDEEPLRPQPRITFGAPAGKPEQRPADPLPTLGGPPEGSGIWEVVTGPVATNSFAKEIDGFLGTPGAGTAIGALFFKPPPPNGMGMRCAALNTYSYAEVKVTARALTVAMKDVRGRPVQEAIGVACAPLVLTAR
jgi:hypothetical protein